MHNLDSQIMNRVALNLDQWMLTIHDAVITAPGTAYQVRELYAKLLKEVNTNRHTILANYRKSIGATTLKTDIAFMKLHKAVQQADDVEFNASAMK